MKKLAIIPAIAFSIFGFIGITVLIFLWSASGEFSPPLFFKVFASFIAVAFILVGFGMPLGIFFGISKLAEKQNEVNSLASGSRPQVSRYDCPNCGANIGNVEASPSGDVKCSHCNEWWNLHG